MLIARKQLRFLACAHVGNAVAFSLALRAAIRRPGCGLEHVWMLFGFCNILRLTEFAIGLRNEDRAHIVQRAQEPRRWRRALHALRMRVAILRRVRRDEIHTAIPDVGDLAPHLIE